MPFSIGFIFMATQGDVTLRDARAYIEAALALGVVNLGFKDVGLPRAALHELAGDPRGGGARSSRSSRSTATASSPPPRRRRISGRLAAGRRAADEVAPIARAAGLRYSPFPGEIVGHPSVLVGRATKSSPARVARRDRRRRRA